MEADRFLREGMKLTIDQSAMKHVAENAHKQGLGARCLKTAFREVLDEVAFEYFGQGRQGTVKVVFDGQKLRADVKLHNKQQAQNEESVVKNAIARA
jgi:ATP-dependent protease Clp ATPase subunit